MSGKPFSKARALLVQEFKELHIDAALGHFQSAIDKFIAGDWEGVEQKAGKFIEAVTKALVLKAGKSISNPRHFSAGTELRLLENVSGYADALRLVIPRAGIFVYEIVSNRGGRHDANDIDANEMDAKAVVPVISWILAEMIRYCGKTDPQAALELIAELSDKRYPIFEEIDGRPYVNHGGLKPGEVALLVLYFIFPKRITRQNLIESVTRHGADPSAARSGVDRLKNLVDSLDGELQLRGIGREKAEALLQQIGRQT